MNAHLDSRYTETIGRLALGVEPIDRIAGTPVYAPFSVAFDDEARGHVRPAFHRHPANRFVLLYDPYLSTADRAVAIRLFDLREQDARLYAPNHAARRYVPRRLQLALPRLATAETQPPHARICRPRLFPGAAYPVTDSATGLRAQVMRAAAGSLPLRPARWVRVLATRPAGQTNLFAAQIIGRAHGDDRGEFVLLIRAGANVGSAASFDVRLWIFAAPESAPPDAALPQLDPLWDMPLESPASLADGDPVITGEQMPVGHVVVAQVVLTLNLGQLRRGILNFVL